MVLGSFDLADSSLYIYSHLTYEKDATVIQWGKGGLFNKW